MSSTLPFYINLSTIATNSLVQGINLISKPPAPEFVVRDNVRVEVRFMTVAAGQRSGVMADIGDTAVLRFGTKEKADYGASIQYLFYTEAFTRDATNPLDIFYYANLDLNTSEFSAAFDNRTSLGMRSEFEVELAGRIQTVAQFDSTGIWDVIRTGTEPPTPAVPLYPNTPSAFVSFFGSTGAAWIQRTVAETLAALGLSWLTGFSADTDGTLSANSDTRLPTQKAVRTYVDGKVVGLQDLKGDIACAGNPNYPAALKGDGYKVSSAGKIGGASGLSVQVGDWLIAVADNAGGTQAAVGASWTIVQGNLVGIEGRSLVDSGGITSADWQFRLLADATGTPSIYWDARTLTDSGENTTVDWEHRLAYDGGNIAAIDWFYRHLNNGVGAATVDWGNYGLRDSGGNESANWDGRTLTDVSGNGSVDWNGRYLKGFLGYGVMDWGNSFLYDASASVSMDWNNRTLNNSSGSIIVDWSSSYVLNDNAGNPSVYWADRALMDNSFGTSVQWQYRQLINFSGGATVDWGTAELYNASGSVTVNWNSGSLFDSGANTSVNWESRRLYDSGGVVNSVSWNDRDLYDSSGGDSILWDDRSLVDADGFNSIGWQTRQVYDPNGNPVFTWDVSTLYIQPGVTLWLGNAAVAGAALISTHSITVKDSTGTAYRIPVLV